MLISVVMEFDMWCNSFTSVNEMVMMMMINWMSNFMMDDLMMVVWSFVMNVVRSFVVVVLVHDNIVVSWGVVPVMHCWLLMLRVTEGIEVLLVLIPL